MRIHIFTIPHPKRVDRSFGIKIYHAGESHVICGRFDNPEYKLNGNCIPVEFSKKHATNIKNKLSLFKNLPSQTKLKTLLISSAGEHSYKTVDRTHVKNTSNQVYYRKTG